MNARERRLRQAEIDRRNEEQRRVLGDRAAKKRRRDAEEAARRYFEDHPDTTEADNERKARDMERVTSDPIYRRQIAHWFRRPWL